MTDLSKYPWLVVDTWGQEPSIGCWFEATARELPGRISAPYEAGRWKPRRQVQLVVGEVAHGPALPRSIV